MENLREIVTYKVMRLSPILLVSKIVDALTSWIVPIFLMIRGYSMPCYEVDYKIFGDDMRLVDGSGADID